MEKEKKKKKTSGLDPLSMRGKNAQKIDLNGQ